MRTFGLVREMSNTKASQSYAEISKEQEAESTEEGTVLAQLARQASVTSKLTMLGILALADDKSRIDRHGTDFLVAR